MNDLNVYSAEPLIPSIQLRRRVNTADVDQESMSGDNIINKLRQTLLICFIYSINVVKLIYVLWFSVVCYFISFVYQREKSIYNKIVLLTGSGGYLGIF